jgi:hypothetical protein
MSTRQLDEARRDMDGDNSGQVDFEEFEHWCDGSTPPPPARAAAAAGLSQHCP